MDIVRWCSHLRAVGFTSRLSRLSFKCEACHKIKFHVISNLLFLWIWNPGARSPNPWILHPLGVPDTLIGASVPQQPLLLLPEASGSGLIFLKQTKTLHRSNSAAVSHAATAALHKLYNDNHYE